MFQRISNSWELVKASGQVLRADKELLVFPIISFFGVLLVSITFAVPTFLAGIFDSAVTNDSIPVAAYVIGFLFYLSQYFVIFFANTALVGAAMIRLEGGDPTVSDGFQIAMKHSRSILGYALIAATVGMILRAISERAGVVGQIVVSLVGLAWNLATYLVVPVLVVEELGPIDSVKRSGQLLKQTWGEQVAGNFGIGTIFGLFTVLWIFLAVPLFFLAASVESVALMLVVGVLLVVGLATIGLLNATLSGIYSAAVYRYAVSGNTGGFFEERLIANAFRKK